MWVIGVFHVLARALGGAEGGGLGRGSGLVVLVGLLDEKGDASVLSGDDTDSLSHTSITFSFPLNSFYRTLLAIWPSFLRL